MIKIATSGKIDVVQDSYRRFISRDEDSFDGKYPTSRKVCADSMKDEKSHFESDEESMADFWGIAASIDIYGCDPDAIRDGDLIKRFTAELCDLIEMKRFGETQVVHFGEEERVAGYSMVQLIETSLISAHFANQSNAVYLDVFSCKPYDPETVRNFARKYFGGQHTIMNVNYRR